MRPGLGMEGSGVDPLGRSGRQISGGWSDGTTFSPLWRTELQPACFQFRSL